MKLVYILFFVVIFTGCSLQKNHLKFQLASGAKLSLCDDSFTLSFGENITDLNFYSGAFAVSEDTLFLFSSNEHKVEFNEVKYNKMDVVVGDSIVFNTLISHVGLDDEEPRIFFDSLYYFIDDDCKLLVTGLESRTHSVKFPRNEKTQFHVKIVTSNGVLFNDNIKVKGEVNSVNWLFDSYLNFENRLVNPKAVFSTDSVIIDNSRYFINLKRWN